jgi:hypothetical protein
MCQKSARKGEKMQRHKNAHAKLTSEHGLDETNTLELVFIIEPCAPINACGDCSLRDDCLTYAFSELTGCNIVACEKKELLKKM